MLRDDLFLKPRRGAARASAAPAVVRGYLACMPEARSHALLRRALNRTARARAEAVAVPLPVLAVVYFGTHLERLATLRAYERYFKRVVYMSPSKAIADALRRTEARRTAVRASTYHCLLPNKVTYACFAAVAAAHGDGTRGALYFHFDMWLQPWALLRGAGANPDVRAAAGAQHSLLDSLWAAPAGRIMQKQAGPTHLLPLECFNVSRPEEYRGPYPAWSWDRDLPPVLAASADATRLGHRLLGPGRLCIGWADLYYVPRRHQTAFGELAAVFAKRTANAELALPTILHALAAATAARSDRVAPAATAPASTQSAKAASRLPDRTLSDGAPAEWSSIVRPKCWGYCCSSTACPELMVRHACGHRMQLSEPSVRRTFEVLWGA